MNMVNDPLPSAQPGVYKKPPVVEMIFGIRTAQPQAVDPTIFKERVTSHFPDMFTEIKDVRALEGKVNLKSDGTADANVDAQLSGYRFNAPDRAFLAHYLVNSLNLNFLPPYSSYATSLSVFKNHWAFYKELTGEPPVAALVLRYIDRIDIPRTSDSFNLSDYFTIAPPTLGLKAHNCYMQYALNDGEQEDIRARVIWSSLEDKPGHWSFALDTEATLDPANLGSEDDIWSGFGRLHDWCTHIFNKSLTSKCKKLFQ